MRNVACALIACVLAVACAAGSAPVREPEFTRSFEVVSPSGAFRASSPFPVEFQAGEEPIERLEIAMEPVPARCFVYEAEIGLAGALQQLSDGAFEAMDRTDVRFDRQIADLRAGAIDDVAYQAIKWAWRAGREGGDAEFAAANKHGLGLFCFYLGPSHGSTFGRVFEHFVRSFQAAQLPHSAFYEEIAVIRVGELTVGVEVTRLTRDSEGDVRVDVASSTLIPTSPTETLAEYGFAVEWSDSEGALINASSSGGGTAQETELELRWSDERGWHVVGRFQTKELDADLTHEGTIQGRFAEFLALTQQLSPRGSAMHFESHQWVPDLDPTQLQAARLEVVEPGRSEVRGVVGPVQLNGTRGDDGLLHSGVVTVGNVQMSVERVYRNGGP